jgi:hypothetical protein
MRNKFVGDIGDYAKFALLRTLMPGARLGVAWYLLPDEGYFDYLKQPKQWRALDEGAFDRLKSLVENEQRTVRALEQANILPGATSAGEPLEAPPAAPDERAEWRRDWFQRALKRLSECELVFADPDKGIRNDFDFGCRKHWESMPVAEAQQLAVNRPAIIYHHFKRNGKQIELEYWMNEIPECDFAVYWKKRGSRFFFVLNANCLVSERLKAFSAQWSGFYELFRRSDVV